jgi:hypothetical protein
MRKEETRTVRRSAEGTRRRSAYVERRHKEKGKIEGEEDLKTLNTWLFWLPFARSLTKSGVTHPLHHGRPP